MEIKALIMEMGANNFRMNSDIAANLVDIKLTGSYDLMRQRPGMDLSAKINLGIHSIYGVRAGNKRKLENFYSGLSKIESVMEKFCKAVAVYQRCEKQLAVSNKFMEERRKDLHELEVKYEMNMISELEYEDCKSWLAKAELDHSILLVELQNAKADLEIYLGKDVAVAAFVLNMFGDRSMNSDVLAQEYKYKASLDEYYGTASTILPSLSASINMSGSMKLEFCVEYSLNSFSSMYYRSLESEYGQVAYMLKLQHSQAVCEKKVHSISARKDVVKTSYKVFLQRERELSGAVEAYKAGKVGYDKVSTARVECHNAYNEYMKRVNDYQDDVVDYLKETGVFKKVSESFYKKGVV